MPGHLVNKIRSLKKLDNGLVETRQISKLFFPIGVWQTTKIEDSVSIHRRSTLEAERLEQQCRARLQRALGKTADGHTQFKRCHDACIDCTLCRIRQWGQHLAFAQDPFTQRRVFVGQGMSSSRFAIPLQQFFCAGFEEDNLRGDSSVAELFEAGRKGFEKFPAARIDTDGHPFNIGGGALL